MSVFFNCPCVDTPLPASYYFPMRQKNYFTALNTLLVSGSEGDYLDRTTLSTVWQVSCFIRPVVTAVLFENILIPMVMLSIQDHSNSRLNELWNR